MPRRPADEEQAVEGVVDGRCYAGLATASSGAARSAGLVPVIDDLTLFPAFVVAPVVREGSPADRHAVVDALQPVIEALDTPTLARINAEHHAGADMEELGERFLDEVLAEGG